MFLKILSSVQWGERGRPAARSTPIPVFIPVLGSSRVPKKGKRQHDRAAVPEPEDWLLR